MAGKFHGAVGFVGNVKKENSKAIEEIVERLYFGEVVDNRDVDISSPDKVNPDIVASHSISIVADDYANEHFSAVRFVEWAGVCWRVTNAALQRPRLVLRLGGVYNGPRAPAAPPSP